MPTVEFDALDAREALHFVESGLANLEGSIAGVRETEVADERSVKLGGI
jgi:hypothetical protein